MTTLLIALAIAAAFALALWLRRKWMREYIDHLKRENRDTSK